MKRQLSRSRKRALLAVWLVAITTLGISCFYPPRFPRVPNSWRIYADGRVVRDPRVFPVSRWEHNIIGWCLAPDEWTSSEAGGRTQLEIPVINLPRWLLECSGIALLTFSARFLILRSPRKPSRARPPAAGTPPLVFDCPICKKSMAVAVFPGAQVRCPNCEWLVTPTTSAPDAPCSLPEGIPKS